MSDGREFTVCVLEGEMTTIQRTALLVYHLAVLGKRMTTGEVAQLVGVSERGALYIMHRISGTHEVPLAYVHGQWFLLKDVEDF